MDVAPPELTAESDTRDSRPAAADARPLCVDLDGTLIAGDLLWESMARLARQRPMHVFLTPVWLASGKAGLKHNLAARVRVDAAHLPYRDEVLDFLREQKATGRRLVLVTASHTTLARAVADHLGLFDEVMASDETRNLKGETKLKALQERFPGGFDYVGDSPADLCLWQASGQAYMVGARASLAAKARSACDPARQPRELCPRQGLRLRDFKLLRPHQWVKNVLLFLPPLLAHELHDRHKWLHVLVAFLAFSLTASSVYVVNDLLDVEADRQHPTKRARPFASGRVPLTFGPPLLLALLGASALICLFLPVKFVLLLGFYLLVSTAYSLYLKTKLLVDIMVLAGLYTLRILAGGFAAEVPVSKWLAAFSIFLFVSLAFAKRYTELAHLENKGEKRTKGRGYEVQDLRIIEAVGPASGYLAVMVLALYINDSTTGATVHKLYAAPTFLWLLCPLLMYWVTRVWFYARRRILHDDPIVFAIKDRISWYCLAIGGALVVLASVPWPALQIFTSGGR